MTQAAEKVGGSGRSVARSILLVVLGSALTPLVGALSGPILARNLGVDGRGAVAAATAPLLFALAVGTLGLPEALTFRERSAASKVISRPWISSSIADFHSSPREPGCAWLPSVWK